MNGLLKSRKFWLAVFAVVQTVTFHFVDIPRDIWISIDALIIVLISGIAIEDAAAKRSGILPGK